MLCEQTDIHMGNYKWSKLRCKREIELHNELCNEFHSFFHLITNIGHWSAVTGLCVEWPICFFFLCHPSLSWTVESNSSLIFPEWMSASQSTMFRVLNLPPNWALQICSMFESCPSQLVQVKGISGVRWALISVWMLVQGYGHFLSAPRYVAIILFWLCWCWP